MGMSGEELFCPRAYGGRLLWPASGVTIAREVKRGRYSQAVSLCYGIFVAIFSDSATVAPRRTTFRSIARASRWRPAGERSVLAVHGDIVASLVCDERS